MVICFEEKDRAIIEAKGITVIEFKRILYNTGKCIKHVQEALTECGHIIVRAWNVFKEQFFEAVDAVRMMIEAIKDHYHRPVSYRYKIVKVFSKCTGTRISFGWKITWKFKRWLARSRCWINKDGIFAVEYDFM